MDQIREIQKDPDLTKVKKWTTASVGTASVTSTVEKPYHG
jgi:hypothetical protein